MASINGKLSIGARAGANLGAQTRYIPGPRGPSGVFVGSGEMPEDCNVQIDPNGAEDDALVLTTAQTLSEGAQAQARENIGAAAKFYVTIDSAALTADKTNAEIYAAYTAGMGVHIVDTAAGLSLPLVTCDAAYAEFSGVHSFGKRWMTATIINDELGIMGGEIGGGGMFVNSQIVDGVLVLTASGGSVSAEIIDNVLVVA